MHEEWSALFARHADARRCLDTLSRIWQNDRLFSFDAFARTARACAERMAEAGLAQIESLPLAADGFTTHGDWVIPQAWDARAAQLRIVAPQTDSPVLADYPAIPCSLVMYSAPTPPGGVIGQVLLVEDIAALAGQDVRGKLLFLRNDRPQSALQAAIAGGALGILSDFMPRYPGVRDSRTDVYDTYRWENAFAIPRNDAGMFAFSLSPREGDRLCALLAQGAVTLHAQVDATLYDGHAATVSALVPGQSEREVFAYAHLYEPGAEDNASGCAALLEAAWLLRELVAQGHLPRPRRGIRIAMGFECAGSMGYFAAHPERIGLTDAGLVADMVGTQAIDRAVLTVWHNPLANYGYTDRLIVEQIEAIARQSGVPFPYREKRFSIGTDNILSDPCFRMPTVALIAEPALSYHSSLDSADRIEPEVLLRSAVLCAMYLYATANAPAEAFAPDPLRAVPDARGADPRVPVRQVLGCLTLEGGARVAGMTQAERARWQPAWSSRLNTPLFWADGRRTVAQIAARSAQELDVPDPAAYAEEISAYFTFLEKHGYIAFV